MISGDEDTLHELTITVTRSALLVLERDAKARHLRPEDVAGEAVDLHARRSAQYPARFAEARARLERQDATA